MKLDEGVKLGLTRLKSLRFELEHRKAAERILRDIRGRKDVPKSEMDRCLEYASDVLGSDRYAHWLRVYTAVSGHFKEGWIPDNYYGRVVVPRLKGSYGKISNLKPLNKLIFDASEFPDLASFVNGCFFDESYNVIDQASLRKILFVDAGPVIYKIDEGKQGLGVHVLTEAEFDPARVPELGNGVFQRFIDQHETLSQFASRSVATLRLTSVVDDLGACSVRAAYVRFGAEKDDFVKSSTHIRVGVDLESGVLSDYGYTPDWFAISEHPFSRRRFANQAFPAFRKCVSTVVALHEKVPFVRVIGWDVTVDVNDDVRIMEWNGDHNDIKFSEATQGPCFADLGWEKFAVANN